MANLYPLLLIPEFHERVWGTRDLRPVYSRVVGKEPVGEAWVASDECKIANGPLAGQTLGALCRQFGERVVGETAPYKDRFPLLTKFLFPREKLSVQVHPDDAGAARLGLPNGKTECWYVMRSLPGATVGVGLKPGTSPEQFVKTVQDGGAAEDLLQWLDARPGEMFYIGGGTVHAIGPNSILIETQQNSDTTFRLYDYGRPRQLHIEQGLSAMSRNPVAGRVRRMSGAGHDVLVASPCFVVERYKASSELTIDSDGAAAQVLVAAEGSAAVECDGAQPVSFNTGEAVVIPADLKQVTLRPQWSIEFLRMYVPAGQLAEPLIATEATDNAPAI
jgi:mannose-6-phosphate isomerase